MKKTFLPLFLTVICVMSFCFNASASDSTSNIISYGNIDMIFDSDSTLSYEDKLLIAEYIVNGTDDAQTYGLLCNLFGHKNTTEYVTTITHEVNATAPRCLSEDWELLVCSRCDNVEGTRLDYTYIYCCP